MSFYPNEQWFVSAALRQPGPFWFDNLAPLLAEHCWSKLKAKYGFDRSNYGTARILQNDPFADRELVAYLEKPTCKTQAKIMVECLRPAFTERYREYSLQFYSPDEILNSDLSSALSGAFKIISVVNGAAAAVTEVLSTIHILKPHSTEYDVSYSEPLLPFSIFVGIAPEAHVNRDIRLAESVVHECMHLQLSLIEDVVPLVAGANEVYLSPWRQETRPISGVVHALYVFRVIQDFFNGLLVSGGLKQDDRKYASRRIEEIDNEVAHVAGLSLGKELTAAGAALARRLEIGSVIDNFQMR
jgi:hypothetical protein